MLQTEAVFDANRYRGKWVAFRLNTEEVVGAGETLEAARQEAVEKGVSDAEFYRVPASDGT